MHKIDSNITKLYLKKVQPQTLKEFFPLALAGMAGAYLGNKFKNKQGGDVANSPEQTANTSTPAKNQEQTANTSTPAKNQEFDWTKYGYSQKPPWWGNVIFDDWDSVSNARGDWELEQKAASNTNTQTNTGNEDAPITQTSQQPVPSTPPVQQQKPVTPAKPVQSQPNQTRPVVPFNRPQRSANFINPDNAQSEQQKRIAAARAKFAQK